MAVVVFLHGSGSSGRELRSYLEVVGVPVGNDDVDKSFAAHLMELSWSLSCPTAPERPYTGAMNMPSNIWFDRSSDWMTLGRKDKEDLEGIEASMDQVAK